MQSTSCTPQQADATPDMQSPMHDSNAERSVQHVKQHT
jgi:hypothetical protein